MSEDAELKKDINNFVWMHADGQLKLEQAEKLACTIFDAFIEARRLLPVPEQAID